MPRKNNEYGGRSEEGQKMTGTGVLLRARFFFIILGCVRAIHQKHRRMGSASRSSEKFCTQRGGKKNLQCVSLTLQNILYHELFLHEFLDFVYGPRAEATEGGREAVQPSLCRDQEGEGTSCYPPCFSGIKHGN